MTRAAQKSLALFSTRTFRASPRNIFRHPGPSENLYQDNTDGHSAPLRERQEVCLWGEAHVRGVRRAVPGSVSHCAALVLLPFRGCHETTGRLGEAAKEGAAELSQAVVGAVLERPEEGVLVGDVERDDLRAVLERAVEAFAEVAVGGVGEPGDVLVADGHAGEHEGGGWGVPPGFVAHGILRSSVGHEARRAAIAERTRHLTTGQKAALALDLLPRLEEEARERQGTRTDIRPVSDGSSEAGRADEKAAQLVGVGRSTVAHAKSIQRHAGVTA